MKILILRFSSIGDIVLTTPVIRALKTQLNAEIHFCTKKRYSILLDSNPYIDRKFFLDGNLSDLIKELRVFNYDFIVDLHNNLRSRYILFRLNRHSRSFDKINFKKWLSVNFKISCLPDKHIVDRYFETVSNLGVVNDGKGLDYFIPEKEEINIVNLPEGFQQGYCCFVIGGGYETKKLPVYKIIEFCTKINLSVVLLGGNEDIILGEEVVNKQKNIFNACGKYNLNQCASLLKQSEFVISHDTGLMHIAASFKKKIYSIWGNTIPEFGMYPYMTENILIENKKMSCRPCSKLGYNKCPVGHFRCMEELEMV